MCTRVDREVDRHIRRGRWVARSTVSGSAVWRSGKANGAVQKPADSDWVQRPEELVSQLEVRQAGAFSLTEEKVPLRLSLDRQLIGQAPSC